MNWAPNFKDFVPAIAALLGVLVGALVSLYVARLQFRAQVNARHRQELMAVLRDTVAEFQSLAAEANIVKWTDFGKIETEHRFRDRIGRMALLSNKIGIVIDRHDPTEARLFLLAKNIVTDLGKSADQTTPEAHGILMDGLLEITQAVLQKQWSLMRRGK